jgi:hypothetical protein
LYFFKKLIFSSCTYIFFYISLFFYDFTLFLNSAKFYGCFINNEWSLEETVVLAFNNKFSEDWVLVVDDLREESFWRGIEEIVVELLMVEFDVEES